MPWPSWPKMHEKALAQYVLKEVANLLRLEPGLGDALARPDGYSVVAEAIYRALADCDVRYSPPLYHPERAVQEIRDPVSILHGSNVGTCLDLALLYAGAALGNDLLPLVVLFQGHALVAVATARGRREATQPIRKTDEGAWVADGILREAATLRKLVDRGDYILVECTGFSAAEEAIPETVPEGRGRVQGLLPFDRATAAGREQLDRSEDRAFLFAVDVAVLQDVGKLRSHEPPPHPVRGLAVLDQAPPLLGRYIRRPEEERRLEGDLLRGHEGPEVVVSAVFGLGGIGKSTLAAAVARSQRIRERFSDGVLWATLGQAPELMSLLTKWIRDLGDHEFRPFDLQSASARLRKLLEKRVVLLVVDNAWDSEHVKHFCVGGRLCRLLVTTRKPRIAQELHAIEHQLDVFSPDQAVELLAARLDRPLGEVERGLARRLAEAVGRLPLALELASARGRKSPEVAWEDLLAKLEQEVAALEALEDQTKPWKKSKEQLGLEASLQLSLRALRDESEEAFRCFVWLGVLPDDTTLAAPMASALWDFQDTERADLLLEFLWGEALLQPAAALRVGEIEWPAYRLHDLLHDCARRLLDTPQTPTRQDSLPGLGLTRPEAHRQLLERFRKRTRDGLWHKVAADGYIHGRLGWHLEKAGDVDGLHALLREETAEGRNGWYEANERLGQPTLFADCVAQAWRLADQAFGEGRPALGLQCRYALMSVSLHSLASNLPPELLEELVRQGVWPVEQALAYARRTPDAVQKAKALRLLVALAVPAGRAAVLGEALDAAHSLGGGGDRSRALAALAPNLPEHERASLLSEALDAARSMRDEQDRFSALTALVPHLPEHERARVLRWALDKGPYLRDEEDRSSALTALEQHLTTDLLSEFLDAACSGHEEWYRSITLAFWVPELPADVLSVVLGGEGDLLRDVLAMARRIAHEDARSRALALAALAPYLPERERASLLNEALDAARYERNQEYRSSVLTALVPHWPEHERAAVLKEALDAACSIGDEKNRSRALAALVPHLPERVRARVLSEALAAARSIGTARSQGDEWDRFRALAALAPHLPADLLSRALDAARSIGDEGDRSTALAALVPHLPEQERARVLSEALAAYRSLGAARSTRDIWNRSEALEALAPHLPADLLREALDAARSIEEELHRSRALAALVPHWPEHERAAVLKEALDAVRSSEAEEYLYSALWRLLPHLPEHERARVQREAFDAARCIGEEYNRSRALAELAPHLPADLLREALDAARSIEDDKRFSHDSPSLRAEATAWALNGLAPHLPADLLSEALDAARSIKNEEYRSSALTALVPRLPEHERARVLSEALDAARSIGDTTDRFWALKELVPHSPAGLLSEALDAARSIEEELHRSRALAALVPRLPEHERARVLSEALDAARSIENEKYRSLALTALVPRLPEHERARVLSEALDAARSIGDTTDRFWALKELVPHLPAGLLSEALDAARSIEGWKWTRSPALEALAPHLANMPLEDLSVTCTRTLHVLADRTRPDLLGDLPSLAPILGVLAQPDAAAELFSEVARAISDVARWWP